MPRNPKTLIPVGVTFGRLTVIDSVADIDGHEEDQPKLIEGD